MELRDNKSITVGLNIEINAASRDESRFTTQEDTDFFLSTLAETAKSLLALHNKIIETRGSEASKMSLSRMGKEFS